MPPYPPRCGAGRGCSAGSVLCCSSASFLRLPPQTILGGWLYVTACHLARTHQRTHARRWQRENQPEAMENLMNPAQDTLWRELEPLLDNAMLTLSQRQRELVLFRYFQNNSQRAAASLVGCSESVASRELAAAIESLRRFFTRHGVDRLGNSFDHSAQHARSGGIHWRRNRRRRRCHRPRHSRAHPPSAAPLLLALMKTTTTAKIIAAAAALFFTSGTVHYFTRTECSNRANRRRETNRRLPCQGRRNSQASARHCQNTCHALRQQTLRSSAQFRKKPRLAPVTTRPR